MKGKNDSVKILSISEIKERITRELKWEQGYNWYTNWTKAEKERRWKSRSVKEKKKYYPGEENNNFNRNIYVLQIDLLFRSSVGS